MIKIIYKRKLLLIFVIIFFVIIRVVYSENKDIKIYSPDKKNYLYFEEVNQNNFKIFVYNGKYKKDILIYEGYFKYELKDNLIWYNNDLCEIKIPYGSPFFLSIFYSIILDKISKPLYFVITVEPNNYLALIGDEDVYVCDIFFEENRYYIERDYEVTAIKWLIFDIKNTNFDNKGNLFLKYLNSKKKWIEEEINNSKILNTLRNFK